MLRSPTQRRLTDHELTRVTVAVLGGEPSRAQLLPGGTYSTAYELELADGTHAVLKVGPPPEAALLTYERDLAATEAHFSERASAVDGVPAPHVLGTDLDGEVVGRELVVLEHLDGRSLNEVAAALTDEVHVRVRRKLGAICAQLHTLTGDRFGYVRSEPRHDGSSWRTAFLSMVDDLVADAERIPATRPTRALEVAAAIRRHADDLDAVERPVLVHFDLWDGNVLVDVERGRISGIIDGERAFYGDPLAEFASLAVLRDDDAVERVMEGYGEQRGEPLLLDPPELRRLAFYRLYLHLLMLIEPVTRGYPLDDPPQHLEKVHDLVDQDLRLLARPR